MDIFRMLVDEWDKMNLRFDQRPWIWIRFLIKCREFCAQNDCWEKQKHTEDNTSPETILQETES